VSVTRAREILLAMLLVLATLSPTLAARAPETLADPAQEARARALQKEFRCPVCQGQSLDDSNAPLAADLRHLIRERIVAGDSDEKIEQFLASRYGNFILMRPPFEISTYFLWLMPVLVLISGAAIATFVIVRAQKRPD
jgi:cytochrome c-type biogenesis protein CcmH